MDSQEFPKTKSEWIKIMGWIIATAVACAIGYFTSSCSVNHKVIQSSYNATTGDSIVIRYEQIGRLKK